MNQSAATQDSDQSPVSFSDSLQAASNAAAAPAVASGTGSTTAHKQKTSSDDDKPSGAPSNGHAVQQQDSSQQTPQAQQPSPVLLAQLTTPIVIPVQLPLDVPVVSSDASIESAGKLALNAAPASLAGAASVGSQLTDNLPTAIPSTAVLAGAGLLQSVLATAGVGNKDKGAPIGTLANSGSDSFDPAASAGQGDAQASLQPANATPQVNLNLAANAAQGPQTQTLPAQDAQVQANAVQIAVSNTPAIAAPTTPVNTAQDAIPVAGAGAKTDSSATANVNADAARNPVLDAALKAVSNSLLNAQPVPVLHTAPKASTKDLPVSTTAASSTGKATSQSTSAQSLFASSLGASGSISDQLAALTQHNAGVAVKGQANASGVNSTTAAKPAAGNASNGTIADAAGPKQHVQAASDAGSQAGSQDASSSSDQGQSAIPVTGQGAAQPQVSFADHAGAAVSQVQSAAIASSASTTPTLASGGHAVKAQDNTASASIAVPDASPAINSARLIQSMGQTEMRVGMRSNEFGNISINTSSTRDVISAQISVDHGELAKTLAAHLPEMQARLGGDQPMNVRIDMNGVNTGLGSGTSGGTANGSADQSQGGRQQASNASSSYSANSIPERQFSPVAAAMASGDGRLNARLDITV